MWESTNALCFGCFLNGAAFFNYFAAQCFHEKTLVKWVYGLEMIREKLKRGEGGRGSKYVWPIPLPAMGFFRVL